MDNRTIVASGIFNIIHKGPLEYLRKAKALGNYLIVLIDSDRKAMESKGYIALDEETRATIIEDLKYVNEAIVIDCPVSVALEELALYIDVFAKGGDRTLDNIPQDEIDVCKKYGIEIITGLGEKIDASSDIYRRIREHE